MGTPKGTQRKIKSNNFKYKQQLKKPNQLTPAPPNVWKGPTRKSWPFLFVSLSYSYGDLKRESRTDC